MIKEDGEEDEKQKFIYISREKWNEIQDVLTNIFKDMNKLNEENKTI